MFKNASLALLAGAACLAIDSAAAFDGAPPQEPTIIYARESVPESAPTEQGA